MQKEIRSGRVRNIGVSNFGMRNLKKLLSHPMCSITPAVNQLEVIALKPKMAVAVNAKQKQKGKGSKTNTWNP